VSKKLYIGNIPFGMNNDQLKQAFSKYVVKSASIVTDKADGRSRGFAFIEVENGELAITEMNGKSITISGRSRDIIVNEARERETRPVRAAKEQSYNNR
jgi:RNA recognition motif-containing protein